jgi:hypothetical protein
VSTTLLPGPAGSSATYVTTGLTRWFGLVFPFVFIVGIGLALREVVTGAGPGWFLLPWCVGAAWGVYQGAFRTVRRIDVRGTSVVFTTTFGRRFETTLTQIDPIRARRQSVSYAVRYDGGKLTIGGPMNGWYDFVSRVKAANPAVELWGV